HLAFMYSQVGLLQAAKAGTPITPTAAQANDSRIMIAGALILLMVLVAGIVWLVWLHRAYGNIPMLTRRDSKYTPGWAVGYYFIPFLNLVRVPQTMSETWEASDGGPAGGALVVCWWLAWIFCGIISRLADTMFTTSAGSVPSLDSLINGSWVYVVADVLRV